MRWPFGLGEFSINCYCLWFMLLFRVVEGNKIKGPSVMIIKDHKLLFQFTFVFFIFLLFLCRFEFNVSIGEFSRPTYAVYNENRKRNKTLMAILNNFWGINATFRCQSCAVWKKIGVRYYRHHSHASYPCALDSYRNTMCFYHLKRKMSNGDRNHVDWSE